jgi:hypothetical protein
VLATTLSWLIYDIGYYGSLAFTPAIAAIVFSHEKNDDGVDMIAVAREVNIEHLSHTTYIYNSLFCFSNLPNDLLYY